MDPIHEAATRIARRLAEIISSILRDEEKGEFLREAYLAARDEIEAMKSK